MTNEVVEATAQVAKQVTGGVSQQLSQGQEIWNQIITWLTERGVSCAINLLVSVLILVIGWLVIKGIRAAVSRLILKRQQQPTLFSEFIISVVSKACWAFLIVMVLGHLGVNVGPLIAGLGVTGFILGFAFQESLGNLASGLMIALNQPFKVGDYVIVAGLEGVVLKVDMMATELATADNKKVVVPNKSAWGAPITNFSALGKRRVDLQVGVDYGCDVAKAVKVALEAIAKVPGVLSEPAPSVSVGSLDGSQVTINVRPWCACADYWGVYSATYEAVKAAYEKNGVQIPFPQLTVHMDK